MSGIPADFPQINIREQLARIDQIHADIQLKYAQVSLAQREADLAQRDTAKRMQAIRFGPWHLAATSIGGATALFGAALALLKWVGG